MSPVLPLLLIACTAANLALAALNRELLANPLDISLMRKGNDIQSVRAKRSLEHVIKECMLVTSEEGHYYYKSSTDDVTVCGVYLLTDPDKVVEIYFDYIDLPCETGGLVSFVDGWELSGQFFPSAEDHPKPLTQRFSEFCGIRKNKQIFISSQNAALVQYRVPQRGKGFSFIVRFRKNPMPCNILIEGTSDVYTLRNYGKHVNCSLTTLYPAKVKVLSLGVGLSFTKRNMEQETGTIHKCEKRGLGDFVQLGGGEGLDLSQLSVVDSICGMDSLPERVVETILCGVTTVRLVSSGEFDNAVTVAVKQAGEDDIPTATLVCGL
ncbi:corticotropin-releasing factor-binding protein [Lycorma delicatula]|uniref:corticotropin-releasing factor-binding protein n=1 Tax=Lycorma delicatula TaxID=130591 RepID=UPI003F51658E